MYIASVQRFRKCLSDYSKNKGTEQKELLMTIWTATSSCQPVAAKKKVGKDSCDRFAGN
jgi:hypothetical protein